MAKKIIIYTTNTCAYCVMVKKYLESKGQSYDIVNLDEHPEERQKVIELSGARTVPVTVISNENSAPNITVGWNPGKLAAAIAA